MGLVKVHKEGTTWPPHGPERDNYVSSLTLPGGELVIERAKKNVPKADIELLKSVSQGYERTDDEWRHMAAMIPLLNPICEACEEKRNIDNKPNRLKLCGDCCLVWYCDDFCMGTDVGDHVDRCCNPDGPLNTGPTRFAVMKVK